MSPMKKENEVENGLEKPTPHRIAKPRISKKGRLEYLQKAKSHSINNEIEIVQSESCGCFFCRNVFSARDVQDWIDDENGVSALCPECGMDACIGDASGFEIDKAFMKEMNLAFYGEDFMLLHPEAARTYVTRYIEGKITHKPKSEQFYVHYLRLLEEREFDSKASLALGNLFRFGSQFTKADLNEALIHFKNKSLSANPDALNAIGDINIRQMESPETLKEAYECFAKASALGSIEAAYHLADCYQKGFYVTPDPDFAFQILAQNSGEMYHRFAISREEWEDFPEFAVRLADCYATGNGTIKNDELALKYYLMGRLANTQRKLLMGFEKDTQTESKLKNGLIKLARAHNLVNNPVVYDIDTFEDSFVDFSINPGNKLLSKANFDSDSHEFEFDIIFERPTLFFDIGNLNCGFLAGKTSWHFQDVAKVSLSKETSFTKILGDYEEGFKFAYEDENGEDVIIAEVSFFTDKGEFKFGEEK